MTKQKQTAATSASNDGFAFPVRIDHQPQPDPKPDPTPTDRAPVAFLAGAIAGAAGLFAFGAYLGRRDRHRGLGPCADADHPPGPPYDYGTDDDPFSNHYGPFYDGDDDGGD